MNYWEIFVKGYKGYAKYLWHEVTHPDWHNYFYWLLLVSAFFFALELIKPWRQGQPRLRKDFWLDFFYMFFNFFLFSLVIYNAASDVVVNFFNNLIQSVSGFNLQGSNPLRFAPMWLVLIIGFFVRDFVQWWTHRLLHWVPALWEFHKVHHSVEQMGFAAHLRYHWMETVVYRTIEYLPLAFIGIGFNDFFIIHIFTLAVGHYNHSNITVSGKVSGAVVGGLIAIWVMTINSEVFVFEGMGLVYILGALAGGILAGAFILGPFMKIIFNSPEMHIWHHAYELPDSHPHGINFGITLAIWDYIFRTNHIPYDGRDIKLGFPGLEEFPDDFVHQSLHGFGKD